MNIRVTVPGASYTLHYRGAKPMLSIELEGSNSEEQEVEPAWASSIFEDLLTRKIPPAPSSSAMGVGGRSVELSIERGLNRSSFGWWMSVPEGWEPLDEIVGRIQGEAMRCRPHYPRRTE